MRRDKYKGFSDDELYILKRQAIHSSYNIICENKYPTALMNFHCSLLNEIIEEIKIREQKRES